MNRGLLVFLAAALALSTAVPREGASVEEAEAHHDDHPGLIDALALSHVEGPAHHDDDDDHHHDGDADHHHDHEMHLCCAQAPALLAAGVERFTILMTWLPFTAPAPWTRATLDTRTPFHVPLA